MRKQWTIFFIMLCLALTGCSSVPAPIPTTADNTTKQSETLAETSTSAKESVSNFDGTLIFDSYYEQSGSYTWKDLYVLLIQIVDTTPHTEDETPVYALLALEHSDTPMLILGVKSKDGTIGNYVFYMAARNRLYELYKLDGELICNVEQQAIYLASEQAWYGYQPHNLVYLSNQPALPLLNTLTLTPTKGSVITIENVDEQIQGGN